ncbi:MAG: hypothetical protein CVU39_04545 [Chloroflexi bacterium HGW-Chloroflexi-10]|nr:MAG: hypothetical protein CVU39_04545 [Chloroflexi bacterium HGW-Chloroflexi-10]
MPILHYNKISPCNGTGEISRGATQFRLIHFLTKNPVGETTGNEASLTYSGTPVDSGYTYSPDNGGTPAQATLQCLALYFALQL